MGLGHHDGVVFVRYGWNRMECTTVLVLRRGMRRFVYDDTNMYISSIHVYSFGLNYLCTMALFVFYVNSFWFMTAKEVVLET